MTLTERYLECLVINPSIVGVIAPEINLGEEESCEKYLRQAGYGDEEDNQTFLHLPDSNLSDDLGRKTEIRLRLTIISLES